MYKRTYGQLNLLKKLSINKELIVGVLPIALVVIGEVFKLDRFLGSIGAERLYGVPRIYFYNDVSTEYLFAIIAPAYCAVVFLYPLIIRRFGKIGRISLFNAFLMSCSYASFVFYLTAIFCNSLITSTRNPKWYDIVMFVLCVILGIITFLTYFYFCRYGYIDNIKDKSEVECGKEAIDNDNKIKSSNKNKKTNLFAVLLAIIITSTVFMVARLSSMKTSHNPEHIKKYEIIKNPETEYNVIVGYYNGSAVLMKGEINKTKWNTYTINILKGQYRITSINNTNLEYYYFKTVKFRMGENK
jgi:hypothetical protein